MSRSTGSAVCRSGSQTPPRDGFLESADVTIDKSLQRKGRLVRSRNVLKRAERIERLQVEDRWIEGRSPLGLPKVRVVKTVVGKKKKKKTKEDEEKKE
jgi:small basic protein (TIGR04137 family)